MAKVLSVRQPWAWLIVHGGKNVENRTWNTRFRGRFFIHAGKRIDIEAYKRLVNAGYKLPRMEDLRLGGVIGSAHLEFVLAPNPSGPVGFDWHERECYGFVLKDARPYDLIPMKGKLGFFDFEIEA